MSQTLLIGILVFCTACYIFQGFFGKMYSISYTGESMAATPVFATIYGAIVSVLVYAVCARFTFEPTGATIYLGLINGVILFVYNLCLINAAQRGPYSFQTIMSMCGSVLVLLAFDVIYWHDTLSSTQITGVCIMIAAIFITNGRGLKFGDIKRGYFFWVIMLFIFNGAYGCFMDAQQRVMLAAQRNEMIIITFITSAVVSVAYLLITQRGGFFRCFRLTKKPMLFAIGASICAAAAVYQYMILLSSELSSSIVNTVLNGGVLAGSVLLSAFALKERLTKNAIVGICAVFASIVLLSL